MAATAGRPDRELRVVFLPRVDGSHYQKLLADGLEASGARVDMRKPRDLRRPLAMARPRPDIVHLHWLHPFLLARSPLKALVKCLALAGSLLLWRVLRIKIVWTVHNLRDHENRSPRLERFCNWFVARLSHRIIAHCEFAGRELARTVRLARADKIHVIPMGHFGDHYPNRIGRSEARRALGLPESALVLLFLGSIRPYKGVLELIDAFAELGRTDARLVVAGKPKFEADAASIGERMRGRENILFLPEYVDDDRVQVFFNACDAAVFPYRDVLTSASILLAMSFGRACIVPRAGCIPETLDESGAFLYEPHSEAGLLDALERAVARRTDLAAMGEHNRRRVERFDWLGTAKKTVETYRSCLGGGQTEGRRR